MQEKLSVKKVYVNALRYVISHFGAFAFLTIFYFLGSLMPVFVRTKSVIILFMIPYYYLFLYFAAGCYYKQKILLDKQIFFAATIRFFTAVLLFAATISLSSYLINLCFGYISTSFFGGKIFVRFVLHSTIWVIIEYLFIFVLVIFFFIIPSFAFISEISGKNRSLLTSYVKTKGNFIQIGMIVFIAFGITLSVLLPFKYLNPYVAELARAVMLVFNSIVYFKIYDFFYFPPALNKPAKGKKNVAPKQKEILLASASVTEQNASQSLELESNEEKENAD